MTLNIAQFLEKLIAPDAVKCHPDRGRGAAGVRRRGQERPVPAPCLAAGRDGKPAPVSALIHAATMVNTDGRPRRPRQPDLRLRPGARWSPSPASASSPPTRGDHRADPADIKRVLAYDASQFGALVRRPRHRYLGGLDLRPGPTASSRACCSSVGLGDPRGARRAGMNRMRARSGGSRSPTGRCSSAPSRSGASRPWPASSPGRVLAEMFKFGRTGRFLCARGRRPDRFYMFRLMGKTFYGDSGRPARRAAHPRVAEVDDRARSSCWPSRRRSSACDLRPAVRSPPR